MTEVREAPKTSAVPGLAVVGLLVIGVGAAVMVVLAARAEQFTGCGLSLIAAAISFGVIAHVSFR